MHAAESVHVVHSAAVAEFLHHVLTHNVVVPVLVHVSHVPLVLVHVVDHVPLTVLVHVIDHVPLVVLVNVDHVPLLVMLLFHHLVAVGHVPLAVLVQHVPLTVLVHHVPLTVLFDHVPLMMVLLIGNHAVHVVIIEVVDIAHLVLVLLL